MTALDLLTAARAARAAGDIAPCVAQAGAVACAAEAEDDRETAYHAHACVGRAHLARGEPELALGYYRWALDAAMHGGLVRWLAPAYHDLMLASREAGNPAAAKRYAGTAFDLYRDYDPRTPHLSGLIADMAQSEFEAAPDEHTAAYALQAWRAVPVSLPEPRFRLTAAANQMASASVLNIRGRYSTALNDLEVAFAALPDHEGAGACLVQAARGAAGMKEYEDSARLAERAALLAERRGEDRIVERARHVLDCALAERKP